MKKLSASEYSRLLLESSRGEQDPLIKGLMELSVGESVFVSKDEWVKKTPIQAYVGNYKRRMGMSLKINKLKNEKGWIIKRTA